MSKQEWPAWYNGPNGETKVFQAADEVPAGWTTGAEKSPAPGAQPAKAAPPPPPPAASKPPVAPKAATTDDLDAHGHPWTADLYAPTKTKTSAGLWRMKVGKSRPAPLPGFPKPVTPLDL